MRAAPVASFIILALVWIRSSQLPAFIAFLMVVPVVWGNVEKGLREIDGGLLEMAQVYRLSRLLHPAAGQAAVRDAVFSGSMYHRARLCLEIRHRSRGYLFDR